MQSDAAGRASGPPEPVLRAESISKRFGGVIALDDVSFDVRPGEVHTLAGENGSGKSTLIKIVAGVETADAGTIEVGGGAHAHLTPRQAIALGIQVIFQDFSLFPNLSVAENIAVSTYIGQRRRTIRPAEFRRVAAEVVSRIGVRLDLDAPVEELSVADRQLTAICRALAQEARIIFMDEPTTALTRREVEALFRVVSSSRRTASRSSSSVTSSRRSSSSRAHHRAPQRRRRRHRRRVGVRPLGADGRDDGARADRHSAAGHAAGGHGPAPRGAGPDLPGALRGRQLLRAAGRDPRRHRAARLRAHRDRGVAVRARPGRLGHAHGRGRRSSGSARSRTRSPPAWATSPATV